MAGLSEPLQFRMHEREARALRAAAKASGVSLSLLLRALAREALREAGNARLHVGPAVPIDAPGFKRSR